MLTFLDKSRTEALTQYKADFHNTLFGDYDIRIKPGLEMDGTRCLYYHEPDNTIMISHLRCSQVHMINLVTGKLRVHNFHTRSVRKILVYNGEIITAGWDGKVRVVNYHTLKERLVLTDDNMGRSPYVTVSDDGEALVSFSYDSDIRPETGSNSLRIWTLKDGQFTGIINNLGLPPGRLKSGSCLVRGNMVYAISDSGHLSVFDLKTCQLLKRTFLSENLRVMCIHASKNQVFVGDIDGNIHVCRLSDATLLYTISCHQCDISTVRVLPGREDVLITTSFDGDVRFWMLPDFSCEGVISCESSHLWTHAFRKNIFFTGSEEGEIWVYDISDLQNLKLKGKVIITGDSFIVCPVESKLFYTNDLSNMEVRHKGTGEIITGKHAEYMLNAFNKESVLGDVFRTDDELRQSKPLPGKPTLQLTESSFDTTVYTW